MRQQIREVIEKIVSGGIDNNDKIDINSIEFLEVVCELEKKFNINFESWDILWDNFNTINKMEKLVKKYLNRNER